MKHHEATIGRGQAAILDILADGEPRRKVELAAEMRSSRSHAYKVVARLIARGFVRLLERVPERAGKRVEITPRGYEALARWREDGGK